MSEHSPGPWVVIPGEMNIEDDMGFTLAHVINRGSVHVEADAALMSAAPDLLASLLEFMDSRAPDYAEADHPGAYERARAAIAKAQPASGGSKRRVG